MPPRSAAHEGSRFIRHCPCAACGSSDANSLYDDGHTHCFQCGARTAGDGSTPTTSRRPRVAGDLIQGGEVRGLISRRINDETCAKYGYVCADNGSTPVQVAPYYDKDFNLVAQKLRTKDKKFSVRGDLSKALPFGAHAWRNGGKRVVLTEGEIDCLTMSQVQGNTWPTLSVPSGAQSARKHVADNLDYYRKFGEVIVMFDNDEPGQKAAQEVAEVLGSRARIAHLPLKDPNEMLVAGRTKELLDAFFAAKAYRPEGIVDMATLKDRVKERPVAGIPWWLPGLTSATYGKRLGEIYCIGAGTGVGKTDFLTQDMDHMVEVNGESIGVFSLEQAVTETALRIAAKAAKTPLHIPDCWDEKKFDAAWEKLNKGPAKVYLYDSFGANEWEAIKGKIEFLAHAEGVRWFYLDHLTALAAAAEDERVALEQIMADMGALVKRLNITIHLVSHLATPEKGSHEEGARVTIRQFKGSRAIGFWCHYMVGLERDQQAADESSRTTTTLRVLKDRFTGRATGQCFYLGYQQDTGMLFETKAPDAAEKVGFKDESQTGGVPSDF